MEQELNTKQQLTAWMANPENIIRDDADVLGSLTEKYPYFQPLHLLLAKAVFTDESHSPELAAAALYNGGQLVHRTIHGLQQFPDKDFNIVSYLDRALPGEPQPLEEAGIDEVMAETESQVDEQETFDEIGEININDYRQEIDAIREPQVLQLTYETLDTQFETMSPPSGIDDEASFGDDLVLENIVSTDFFAFQDNFKVEDVLDQAPQIEEYSEQAALDQESVISKYDDDKLPYTFLWWLAKTRKEHQQIFQPYASPKQQKTNPQENHSGQNVRGELQQQYVENIFHMQSAFGDEDPAYIPVGFRRNSKGDEIIESFIKNEPQISPPKPEHINNENKARRSAEDHSDMVSETLAKIYIEQMLYDKAIETYEKLSLMFPEKSRYFADLIQSIEKKI